MGAKKPVEIKKSEAEFETKLVPLEIETLSEADGSFSGLAIPYESLHGTSSWMLGDDWQDKVAKGAFGESLAAHKSAGTMPLLQWMHERGNIVGTITSAKETAEGVRVEGKVSPRAISPSGVPVLELLRSKAVSGLSVGFRAVEVSLDEKTKVRTIQNVDWRELSVVDIPGAGDAARVTDIKSERDLEAVLVKHGGLSRKDAKTLLAKGFGALERYQTKAADPAPPPEPLAPAPASGELKALVENIKASLSPRDADGAPRDAVSTGSVLALANQIIDTLRADLR